MRAPQGFHSHLETGIAEGTLKATLTVTIIVDLMVIPKPMVDL